MSFRPRRVADQVRRELADLLMNEVHDPRLGFVTVTEVRMSGDLHHATVWVSILGDDEVREQTLGAIVHAGGFLRRAVAGRLRLREAPELHFRHDDTLDRSDRIERLLQDNPIREVEVPAERKRHESESEGQDAPD